MTSTITETKCKACKAEIMQRTNFTRATLGTLIAIVGLVMVGVGWSGASSMAAVDRVSDTSAVLREHIAGSTAEALALTGMLESMEARQIEMGKRIDGIFQKLGE